MTAIPPLSLTDDFDDPNVEDLLDAYREASKVAAKEEKESKGWVPRIAMIDGLDEEALATAHGTAIAADMLEIRVEDATSGLRYRPRKAA